MTHGYDAANRLVSVTDWNADETTYAYENGNRMTAVTLPSAVDIVSTCSGDNAGRLTGIEHVQGGTTTVAFVDYTLDAVGGSRFKPATPGTVEWQMKDTVRFNAAKLAIPYIGPAAGGEELGEVIAEILSSPVMHTQLPNHTGDISVASCGSGGQAVLADEVIALIENRAGAGGYQCQ